MKSWNFRKAVASGEQWRPAPHFTFGPTVAAYIQYCILKMCPPPSGFWPPLLLNPGDGPAEWKRFCLLTGESVERLPPPDTPTIERAYQDFCESLLSAAKQCIPRGRRKNYTPCWDKKCETLYRSFIQATVGTDRAASSLLSRLQQKKQERWKFSTPSIFSPLPHLGQFHCLATREERGTRDRRPRVHQARQQAAVRHVEDSNA